MLHTRAPRPLKESIPDVPHTPAVHPRLVAKFGSQSIPNQANNLSGQIFSRYSNATADQLISAQIATLVPGVRQSSMHALQLLLADDLPTPPGQDSLMALVPEGHLGRTQAWDVLRAQARAAVLRRLAKLGVTDLEKHLKFEVIYSPRAWRSLFNLSKGASFGLSHGLWQVGYLRPRNRHSRYRNLYFVGASTHPGGGLPIVLESARLAVERIQQDVPLALVGMVSSCRQPSLALGGSVRQRRATRVRHQRLRVPG